MTMQNKHTQRQQRSRANERVFGDRGEKKVLSLHLYKMHPGSKACSILSPIGETVKSEMVGQEVGVGTTPTDTKPHLVD